LLPSAAKAAASADTAKAVSVPNLSILSAIFICFSSPEFDPTTINEKGKIFNPT
jgi:hypothetical protein